MTIFIIDNPITTAIVLDPKRLNKQIIECQWMINMYEGKTKASNHPVYLMYKDHIEWVKLYKSCLEEYRKFRKDNTDNEAKEKALKLSEEADKIKPDFMCKDLYANFCKRLYEKDNVYYKSFEKYKDYFLKEANYYYVEDHWLRYANGKKEIDINFGHIL